MPAPTFRDFVIERHGTDPVPLNVLQAERVAFGRFLKGWEQARHIDKKRRAYLARKGITPTTT